MLGFYNRAFLFLGVFNMKNPIVKKNYRETHE